MNHVAATQQRSIAARSRPAALRRALCFLLLAALTAVYLVGNSRMPLFDRDEAWYADVSRHMVRSGDWVVPVFRHGIWEESKPVFAYWCQGLAMKLAGQTVFAARLPSAVFGLASLLLVWFAASRFAGPRRAFWTIFVLGTSTLFIVLSKLAMVDIEQLLWIILAEFCLAAIYAGTRSFWISLLLWSAVALAALTKGPVVFATIASTAAILAILDVGSNYRSLAAWRQATRWWRGTQPWLLLLLLPAVLGPWLYLVNQRAPRFLHVLLDNMIGPIFEKPLNNRPSMPPGFYLAVIWPSFLPWSLLLPLTLGQAWRHRRLPQIRFCLAAAIGPYLVIELVKQKLPHYLLPCFPPLAFLTADAIVRCLKGQHHLTRSPSWKWGVLAWAMVIAALGSAPWLLALPRLHYDGLPHAIMTALAAVTAIAAAGIATLLVTGRIRAGLVSMGALSMLLSLMASSLLLPSLTMLAATKQASDAMWHAGFRPGQTVAELDYTEPSITFHLGGEGVPYGDKFLDQPPVKWPRWIIMSGKKWDAIPSRQRQFLDCIGTYRSFRGQIVVLKNATD